MMFKRICVIAVLMTAAIAMTGSAAHASESQPSMATTLSSIFGWTDEAQPQAATPSPTPKTPPRPKPKPGPRDGGDSE